MSWGAVITVGGGLLAGAMSDGDKNGGAGTQTQSKQPWAPAQPWLMQNLLQGQQMQNQLTAEPFSPRQRAAYDNSYAQSDYMRDLIPSLLGQMQDQPVGFDPANPLARPKAWDWNALAGTGKGLGQRSVLDEAAQSAAPKKEESLGDFIQQNGVVSGMNMTGTSPTGLMGNGGFGAFKYGMAAPKAGTKEYRDMSEYFANGGADPNNYYGRAGTNPYVDPNANPNAWMWTSGYNSPAGGGIGDTGANAAAASSGNTAW